MLKNLLDLEIKKRNLSIRKVSEQIGVSHTTICRILNGETVDLPTVSKIGNWLGVNPSTLLDLSTDQQVNQRDRIGQFLDLYPDLQETLIGAIDMALNGQLDPSIVEDVLAYFAFRIARSTGNASVQLAALERQRRSRISVVDSMGL